MRSVLMARGKALSGRRRRRSKAALRIRRSTLGHRDILPRRQSHILPRLFIPRLPHPPQLLKRTRKEPARPLTRRTRAQILTRQLTSRVELLLYASSATTLPSLQTYRGKDGIRRTYCQPAARASSSSSACVAAPAAPPRCTCARRGACASGASLRASRS